MVRVKEKRAEKRKKITDLELGVKPGVWVKRKAILIFK